MKLHLDGARILNAAVALGVPVSQLTEPFDSVILANTSFDLYGAITLSLKIGFHLSQ